MRAVEFLEGLAVGVLLAVLGLGLRTLGMDWPLEGLFGKITHWLGTPQVLNFVHGLLGYGAAAKNLAFAATVGLWLGLHLMLWAVLGRQLWLGFALGFGLYLLWSHPFTALVYAAALTALVWITRRPMLSTDLSRRRSLKTLGLWALGWQAWQSVQAQATLRWNQIKGLSPELLAQRDLYYVSKNFEPLDPKLSGKTYTLELSGLVQNPLSLNLEQLQALPSSDLIHTLSCISNPVGGDLIGCVKWKGVALKTLLEQAKPKPEARFVIWEAADGYVESLPVAELPPEALLAYAAYDPQSGQAEALEARHGYPTRILLPGRYGMKQPKWLTQIRLSAEEQPGYWAKRGWSRNAHIRSLSRIDTPKNRSRLTAGQDTVIAGVCYAGGRPIAKVEVSTDGGQSWQTAQLKPAQSRFAWQLWALPWKPSVGNHTLKVRLVEASGSVQDPSPRSPLPDGSTGLHSVSVRAS